MNNHVYLCPLIFVFSFFFFFLTLQILHGEIKVNADCAMERVVILMNAGKKCLKWIAANIPFVLAQDDEQEE